MYSGTMDILLGTKGQIFRRCLCWSTSEDARKGSLENGCVWEDANALMTLAGIALKPLLCTTDLLQRIIQLILISKSYYLFFHTDYNVKTSLA